MWLTALLLLVPNAMTPTLGNRSFNFILSIWMAVKVFGVRASVSTELCVVVYLTTEPTFIQHHVRLNGANATTVSHHRCRHHPATTHWTLQTLLWNTLGALCTPCSATIVASHKTNTQKSSDTANAMRLNDVTTQLLLLNCRKIVDNYCAYVNVIRKSDADTDNNNGFGSPKKEKKKSDSNCLCSSVACRADLERNRSFFFVRMRYFLPWHAGCWCSCFG